MKKRSKIVIDFNGAFVYMPKGIILDDTTFDFLITNGYFVTGDSIEKAIEEINSKDYKKWLSKFKPVAKLQSISAHFLGSQRKVENETTKHIPKST